MSASGNFGGYQLLATAEVAVGSDKIPDRLTCWIFKFNAGWCEQPGRGRRLSVARLLVAHIGGLCLYENYYFWLDWSCRGNGGEGVNERDCWSILRRLRPL